MCGYGWNTANPIKPTLAPITHPFTNGAGSMDYPYTGTNEPREVIKKALIIDNYVIIGSHNWTYSALNSNREASIMTSDSIIVQQAEELFAGIKAEP